MQTKAAPARPKHTFIHALPIGREFDGIATDQDLGHVAAPQMRGPHLEEAFHHLGWRIGLTKPETAIFIEDFDDYRLSGAVEVVGRLHRCRNRDHLQPRDL